MSTFSAIHPLACPQMFCMKSHILPRCGDFKGQHSNASMKNEVFTDSQVSCGQLPLPLESRFIVIPASQKATPS